MTHCLKTMEIIGAKGVYLGIGTNNEAEWSALIHAFEYLAENYFDKVENRIEEIEEINIYLDSKLVVEQFSGRWKIKEPRLKLLNQTAKNKIEKFKNIKITIHHIYREFNKAADLLVNQTLDEIK